MTQTLTLAFDCLPATTVTVADDADAAAIATAVLALPEVDQALRATIGTHVYPLYSRDNGLEQAQIDAAAKAFLERGSDGLTAWGLSLVDEEDHIERIIGDVLLDATYRDIADATVLAITTATGEEIEPDEVFDAALRERVAAVIATADQSTPHSLIGAHDHVMVCYAPGHEFGVEDDAILGRGKSIVPDKVDLVTGPDGPRLPDGYLAYLRLINAEPASLRTHFAEAGFVLTGPEAETQGHGPAWQRADWGYDPEKPVLHDARTVLTVLENAGDCVIATLTMRVPLRALLAHDFTKPARIVPTGRGKAYAGFINFVHGAGHDEPVRQPVVLPAGREKWLCADTEGWSYRSIFGIVSEAYAVELTAVEPNPAAAAA